MMHRNDHLTAGLRIIMGLAAPPTNQEWLQLIEARLELIRSGMREFSLPTLGSVITFIQEFKPENVEGCPEGIEILARRPCILGEGKKERGVTETRPWERTYYWGIGRDETFCFQYDFRGLESDARARHPHRLCFHGNWCMEAILQFTGADPKSVWETLGSVIERWEKSAHDRLSTVKRLQAAVVTDETAMRLLEERTSPPAAS